MRLTKMFSFEMAHCLWHYEGKCSNLHGHSYKMEVTVEGLPSQENGMVIDFKKLKDIVNETIIDKFDHSTVLYEHTDSEIINALKKTNVQINRKMLADLAVKEPEAFEQIVEVAKSAK